jgi:hypothetical protein
MTTTFLITAKRNGHVGFRQRVKGESSALRVMARLRTHGYNDVLAKPDPRMTERDWAMLVLTVCVVGFLLAVLAFGAYVNVSKRAAFAASVEAVQ